MIGGFCCALVFAAQPQRSISWWFDVAENATVDAANAATVRAHRVMPYNAMRGTFALYSVL
jgi:hypothetical protein